MVKKVVEEHLRRHLNKHFEDNEILLPNNHGSRKGHSTETARAVVDQETQQILEENKVGAVISMDLRVAQKKTKLETHRANTPLPPNAPV